MKQELTELVFILDRSGSMSGLESDTVGGYNSLLEKQRHTPGDAIVTTVLFDDQVELLHNRMHIRDIAPITAREYFVRGSTALLDAVGKTILKIGDALRDTPEDERAGQVLFVITTDGLENASHEFSYEQVRRMIAHQKSKYNWEFLFLGANIDAVATAEQFGIERENAANYCADSGGTQLNYAVISEAVSDLRANKKMSASWKKRIDEDFEERGTATLKS